MLRKRLKSFKYAFEGIADLIISEPNAKIHLLAAIVAVSMGFYFKITIYEWCFVVFAIAFVLSAEAFNTAIEYLTNLVSPEFHPLAKKTKDVAAGAVLLAALGSAIIGLIIFLPKLYKLFKF